MTKFYHRLFSKLILFLCKWTGRALNLLNSALSPGLKILFFNFVNFVLIIFIRISVLSFFSCLCYFFSDVISEENNSFSPPCYHGNLAPSDLSHSLVLSPSNLVQSSDSSHSNSTSDTLYAPKRVTHFHTFKTAERKELSKIRRVPKRVMFSDDLENSQSSGRSSTMSSTFSDNNHVDNNYSHRPNSTDLDIGHSRSRSQENDLRHFVDNLHGNHVLPGYETQRGNNINTYNTFNFNQNTNKPSSFRKSRSYPLELRKSLSSPDESTYTTTTSGSYSLTLDEVSSSPTDEVFVKDLFV